jgi:cob(I)alamin adenosyltransferase
MNKGLIYVFTGDGKGKTSAAIGVGVRAALSGMKVAMVCWYKSPDWKVSEFTLPKQLKRFQVFPMGVGFRITNYESRITNKRGKDVKTASLTGGGRVVDTSSEDEHREAARVALKKAKDLVGRVDVLILDEVNNAVKDGLIDLSTLIDLISKRKKTHLILTGRGAHKKVIALADLVTEMKKVKHPFDLGKKAIRGLDY